MKIALVYDLIYPFSKGGVEKRVRDLAFQLARRGHEVHVYGTKQWDGPSDLESDGVHTHGIRSSTSIHTSRGRRSIRQGLMFALALGRRLARERYDIVDVQNMAPLSCLATLVAVRFARSVPVVTWHEVWRDYWDEYVGWLGRFGRLAEWMIMRCAPNHVAVSATTVRQLAEAGVDSVRLVPNGVDCAEIESAPPSGLAADVIYVGRLIGHKNVDLLIDAVSVLVARGLAPSVLIVGDGPARAGLQSKVATEELDNVSFLGTVESETAVYSLLKSARVFALPSTREGFGLAALEAAAAGLPVVTVDHPFNGAMELVVGRSMGFVTAPSPPEFASALRDVLCDGDLRNSLSRGAKVAAAEYDWSRVAPMAESEYLRFRYSEKSRQNRIGKFRARLITYLKDTIGAYLLRLFRGTEQLNRQAILDELTGVSAHSLLDCGCGDGSFTIQLARQVGAEAAFGVEWDSDRAQVASRNGVISTRADLNAGLPFGDASFDVVHSNQVIEHLQATDTFLRETRRVLKPGGVAVLSTNNLASWHNIASLVIGMQPPPMHISNEVIAGNVFDPLRGSRHPTEGDSHLRIFSFKALRDLCEHHGFDVEVLRSVGYYPLGPRLSRLMTRVDRWHGAFLVAKLRTSATERRQVPKRQATGGMSVS